MTRRHPKTLKRGVMVARKFNPRIHKSKICPPSYLARESQQEFVPEVRLIKKADLKPRLPIPSR